MAQRDSRLHAAYELNRRHWDEVTPVHVASGFYDVPAVLSGEKKLPEFVASELGDLSGRELLHLQCHFGLDTLMLARMGASATGLDFSEPAIEEARRLAIESGVEAEFITGDVTDPPIGLNGRFDVVFTSFGALCWLSDLAPWATTVSGALKPGGMFHIFEFHPMFDSFAIDGSISKDSPPVIDLDFGYFSLDSEWVSSAKEPDYADPDFVGSVACHNWAHGLAEVYQALQSAGLRVDELKEYPFTVYRARDGLIQGDDRLWRLPDGVPSLPLVYYMRADKPG